jgi:hypothetical protein
MSEIKEQIRVEGGEDIGYLKGLYNGQVMSREEQRNRLEEIESEEGRNSKYYGFRNKQSRKRSALMAVLANVGLERSSNWKFEWFSKSKHLKTAEQESDKIRISDSKKKDFKKNIEMETEQGWNDVGRLKSNSAKLQTWEPDFLVEYWSSIRKHIEDDESDNGTSIDEGGEIHDIIKSITHSGETKNIDKYLSGLDKFHNPESSEPPIEGIYNSLSNGELVIVDTTNGSDEITNKFSTSYSKEILSRSMKTFIEGDKDPPKIQVYLEEAHRYFSEDEYDDGNIYVTMAKEGAKFNIGMVYATQEVSMVDDRILSNTANWVVTHLNSDNEINELTDYYDFESFERKIKKVDDKGFARVKTKSSDFVLPVQISLFEDWIENETDYDTSSNQGD